MKNFSRFFLLAAAALAAVFVSFSAEAVGDRRVTIDGVTWIFDFANAAETKAVLACASPATGNLAIPAKLGGATVTGIGTQAFASCGDLTGIVIPGCVKTIGKEAFYDCEGLASATIRQGVREIGEDAFSCCFKLPSVTIPEGMESIGDCAFAFCRALKDVRIPDSVTNLDRSVFWCCENMTNAILGKGVANIGDGLFYLCKKLASVTIPGGVTNIGGQAFYMCASLENVTIPASVTSIGECAFESCTGLASVAIPGSVTNIGYRAFAGCTSLASVAIPASVTRIGSWAFAECDGLKTLYVPAAWEGTDMFPEGMVPAGCQVVYRAKVTFNANGGTCATKSRNVTKGAAVGTLPAPTRSGWLFLGWYTAKSGGSKVAATDKINANRTVYAQWAKPKYTVAFDANGGKGSMAKQTMTYNKAAKLRKNAFKRDGCAFRGWATSKKGDVAYKNRQSVKNLRRDGKTTTLYAKWAKKNYTVAFNANGGKGTMAKQAMTWGTAAKLRKNAFKRSGCKFIGWAKTKGGAVVYKNAAEVKNLTTGGGTVTLYAKWKKVEPTALPPETAAAAPKSAARSATVPAPEEETAWALVTASDRSNGSAVVDGDEATVWTPDTAEGSWVVLTLADVQEVEDVEIVGNNLPERTRFLLSENADDWQEGVPGRAMYVWVVFPAAEEPPVVREIRVRGGAAAQ